MTREVVRLNGSYIRVRVVRGGSVVDLFAAIWLWFSGVRFGWGWGSS